MSDTFKKPSSLTIKLLSISTAIIAIVLTIQLFTYSTTTTTSPKKTMESYGYQIVSAPLPDSLSFATEKVPLHNLDVAENFERELLINTYWQSQTLLFIKRAKRYFPVIEPILKAQGVPDDFKYLALIESSFMPRTVSPVGATGIWQFMKDTAKENGLEVTQEVDERYHIEKATEAACRYLKNAYSKLGSWTLAAASYNGGISGISKQQVIQKNTKYYDLLWGDETGRYVYRILAAKVILSNPEKYGFKVEPHEKYQPILFTIITISGAVSDFADFASVHGTTYKDLKNLNPWLRESSLLNLKNTVYQIKIPLRNTDKL